MSQGSRILIVDDTPSIHEDFRKILSRPGKTEDDLEKMADTLFGRNEQDRIYSEMNYQLDSAFQGEEALRMIEKAEQEGESYSLVFMDVRMPPGQDGIKTVSKIWEKYPAMEIVICTAYSDYSWVDIVEILGPSDHLLVLKKPFDADEAQQMALSMTRRASKKTLQREVIEKLKNDVKKGKESIVELKRWYTRDS